MDKTLLMLTTHITVQTGRSPAVHDLTDDCARFVADSGDGLLHVFAQHATAGLAVIETGDRSEEDLLAILDELLPLDFAWRHQHGSPGHGRSHILPALLPPFGSFPVISGRIELGTWQRICLVDLNVDNPSRRVQLSFLPA